MNTPQTPSLFPSPQSPILWRQVWGLAAMLAAILLSLMIYGMYQAPILKELGFVQLAAMLGVILGLMGAVVEPLVGSLSDRILQKFGSRLPQITVGVTVAGLLFVLIAVLLPVHLPAIFRWLFLLLMILWLTAMIAIRGPVVALLVQFAPVDQLPIAGTILALVLGLVGALSPILDKLFHYLGKSLSFAVGAIILILGVTVFYSTIPRHSLKGLSVPSLPTKFEPSIKHKLICITLVGVGAGIIINVLLGVFIPRLQIAIPAVTSSMMLLISAFATHPLGWLTQRIGVVKAMAWGLGSMLLLMTIACLPIHPPTAVILLIGFAIAFGLVFISSIPLALGCVPFHYTGLSVGLYFGGSSAGSTLLPILKSAWGEIHSFVSLGIAAIAFIITVSSLRFSLSNHTDISR